MIKNLVFDLGDTLISYDYTGIGNKFGISNGEKIVKEFFESPNWILFNCDNRTEEEMLKSWTDNEVERAMLKDVITNHCWIICYPKLYEWIRTMKTMGCNVYILSNYPMEMFNRHIKLVDIEFDGVVVSDDVKMLKPHRSIYEYLLDKYSLNPNETIFFDDRPENLIVPASKGLATVSLKLNKMDGVYGHKLKDK